MSSVSGTGMVLLSAALAAIFMGTIGAISFYAGVSAETITFYRLFIGALLMAVHLLVTGQRSKIIIWPGLKVLVTGAFLAGLVPGFLAIVLAVVALRALPAATFGTLAYLEPITVVALAWVLFDQGLNGLQLFGCLLIILSGISQALLSNRQPITQKMTQADSRAAA
ncbi:MAG: DMT family transporter [Marinobacter sp.]